MRKAKDVMTTDVITVQPDTEITQAANLLLDNHINGMPVVDKDILRTLMSGVKK